MHAQKDIQNDCSDLFLCKNKNKYYSKKENENLAARFFVKKGLNVKFQRHFFTKTPALKTSINQSWIDCEDELDEKEILAETKSFNSENIKESDQNNISVLLSVPSSNFTKSHSSIATSTPYTNKKTSQNFEEQKTTVSNFKKNLKNFDDSKTPESVNNFSGNNKIGHHNDSSRTPLRKREQRADTGTMTEPIFNFLPNLENNVINQFDSKNLQTVSENVQLPNANSENLKKNEEHNELINSLTLLQFNKHLNKNDMQDLLVVHKKLQDALSSFTKFLSKFNNSENYLFEHNEKNF